MRALTLCLAAALAAAIATPLAAQGTTPAGAGKAVETPAPAKAARTPREPTAGQMAARERQKTCGGEWKTAKAAGKTGGLKWPQFWSQCNARLKGSHV